MTHGKLEFRNNHISLDGSADLIGIGGSEFTNSNTRYVCVTAEYLKKWAAYVDEASEDRYVYVGVTPGAPLIAKRDTDDDISIQLAPRVEPEDSE